MAAPPASRKNSYFGPATQLQKDPATFSSVEMKTAMQTLTKEEAQRIRARAAGDEFEGYCATHPHGPAALRRPVLLDRGGTWVALLGSDIENGIVGIGGTVSAALRAFDVRYLNSLQLQGRTSGRPA